MPVGTFVNPEIIMGYKSPDLSGLDPSRMMQNVLAYKQAKTQQQANELALQQSQQKIADQNLMQEAYNSSDPVNYLRARDRVDLADAYKTKQAEAQTADLERKAKQLQVNEAIAKADKTQVDTALQTVRDRFAGVLARHADNLNSEEALKDYLSISQQAHMDKDLAPILGASGAHHAATVQQAQTALENGTLADLIQNSAMSADQLRESIKAKAEAAAPKPTQVDVGGAIKTIDMNPRSKTYLKEIRTDVKTATPAQAQTAAGKPLTALQQQALNTAKAEDQTNIATLKDTADQLETLTDELVGNKAKNIAPHPGLGGITGVSGYFKSAPKFTVGGVEITSGQAKIAEQKLDTIKGKIMALGRQLATEHGKLGNMAVQEWKFISDAVQKIDPTADNFEEQLRNVIAQARSLESRARNRYVMEYDEETSAPAASTTQTPPAGSTAQTAPKIGDVVKGYKFKGGDPANQNSWEKVK